MSAAPTQAGTDLYKEAYELLRSGEQSSDTARIEEGLKLLRENAEANPGDLHALFEYAGAFDFVGRAEEAAKEYERILARGLEHLPPGDRPKFYIQYGSTLRCLKRHRESREILEHGSRKHAGYPALWAFLALTEYSCGEPEKALQTLIQVLLDHPSHGGLSDYSRALRWYAENLRSFP